MDALASSFVTLGRRWRGLMLIGLLFLAPWLAQAQGKRGEAPSKEIMVRARILKVTPEVPCRIHWRWGGEGLGGDVTRGELTAEIPKLPDAPTGNALETSGEGLELETVKPTDRVIVSDPTYNYHYLKPGVWTWWSPLSVFRRGGRSFITFTAEGLEVAGALRDTELELEFAHQGKTIKTIKIAGPDGPTFGTIIAIGAVDKAGVPTPAFSTGTLSLLDYAKSKEATLREQPWATIAGPKLYGFMTDCAGYNTGSGYGVRTTDPETILAEFEVLRMMGCNSTRGAPAFLGQQMKSKTGIGPHFSRAKMSSAGGYPIPSVKVSDGKPPVVSPGDGCPYFPENIQHQAARTAASVATVMANARELPVNSVWALTVDEIGTVFDGAPEGKAHIGVCPWCRDGFREFVKKDGRTLEDFGAPSWDDVRPTTGYWGRSYWDIRKEREDKLKEAKATLATESGKVNADDALRVDPDKAVVDQLEEPDPKAKDEADLVLQAHQEMEALIWRHSAGQERPEGATHKLTPEGWHLLNYYTRRFNCEAAAMLFTPLKNALDAENARKAAALKAGELESEAARQPWVYSFALRGNTFLMGGHSLDFFEFYRYADNAFVYETSNRDARVWQWDSYLCDVGRTMQRFMGKEFGIYVKPHRGAAVQRTLTAAARGAKKIYWYTYGPEWHKGDTFGGQLEVLTKLGGAARLVAAAEDRTYDSEWAHPVEVALVRPLTAEYFSSSASWENGKWVHLALNHAHIPVDALDEGLLLSLDLKAYKVIYIAGDHLRRDVADKLKQWVAAGGTLVTMGHGMSRDESGRPLSQLDELFGVRARAEFDEWGMVPRYGATSLGAVSQKRKPPEGAMLQGQAPIATGFVPVVGREVLQPLPGAEVLAKYGDGGAAVLRHKFGQGTAWNLGVYAGLEYAWETMQRKPFLADKRQLVAAPALAAGVRPSVDSDSPLLEGIHFRHPVTGKQAVYLINWEHQTTRPVTVTLRPIGEISKVHAVALKEDLKITRDGEFLRVTLPQLAEGEVLLLD